VIVHKDSFLITLEYLRLTLLSMYIIIICLTLAIRSVGTRTPSDTITDIRGSGSLGDDGVDARSVNMSNKMARINALLILQLKQAEK